MVESAQARFERQLASSVDYLNSDAARDSFAADPYWPKWNSPWWHMTLMWELHAAKQIPRGSLDSLVEALEHRYIHTFPFVEADIPPGVDPISGIMCHCGLGTAYQVLSAAGVNVDGELPWIRTWIVKYQINDGGWNCEESAYTKTPPVSSVVSSLPMLESLLVMQNRSDAENEALDRGARYLLARQLYLSKRSRQVINGTWLQLTFPRFYEYDILRGLAFVAKWAVQREQALEESAIRNALAIIQGKMIGRGGMSGLPVERQFHSTCKTRIRANEGWQLAESTDFPLLRWCSQVGEISPVLTRSWTDALARLDRALWV